MNGFFYLDTSGLNFLADKVKDFDALIEIKKYLGFELYLSPITLWEILLNADSDRRDFLIYWGQFNCSPHLLKSPTEIILAYLQADCPQKDRVTFFDSPYTLQQIGQTWQGIHRQIDKNLLINFEELKERSLSIRDLSKNLKTVVQDMCTTKKQNDPFHHAMELALSKLDYCKSLTLEDEQLFKISLILLFFVGCIGFELETNMVRDYWGQYGIDDPFERLDCIIEKNPQILIRGPVLEMAKMAEVQISCDNSRSRGLTHDCLHSVYCYYADAFITSDPHFQVLKDRVSHSAFERIVLTEQIERTWHLVAEEMQRGIKNY